MPCVQESRQAPGWAVLVPRLQAALRSMSRSVRSNLSRRVPAYVQSVDMISLVGGKPIRLISYLKLPHDRLAEVFWTGVHSKRNQVATIDPLFTQTPLSLFQPCLPFTLYFPRFSLLSRFSWFVRRRSGAISIPHQAKERKIGTVGARNSVGVDVMY